jgi:hypothetical protein
MTVHLVGRSVSKNKKRFSFKAWCSREAPSFMVKEKKIAERIRTAEVTH